MKLQNLSLITFATAMMMVGCKTDDNTTSTTESSSTTDPATTNTTSTTKIADSETESGTDTGTGTSTTNSSSTSESESASESESNIEVGNCGWSVKESFYACVDAFDDVVPGSVDPALMDPAPIACPADWETFVGQKCEDSQIDGIGCCVVDGNTNVYCNMDNMVIKDDCPED